MKKTDGKKVLKSFIKAMITLGALAMNYGLISDAISLTGYGNPETIFGTLSKLLYSVETEPMTAFFLLGFLLFFYLHLYDMEKLPRNILLGTRWLAFFAAGSVIIGKSFYVYDDIGLLLRGTVQMIKGAIVLGGFCLFFSGLLQMLVSVYIRYCAKNPDISRFDKIFCMKYSGLLIASFLLAAWLPTIVAYYPAVFMGDSEDIIYMAYNYPSGIETTVLPIKEGVYITNHHPVLYTGYVSIFLHGVRALGGSYNLGIFFCAIMQCVITLAILVYSILYCANTIKNEKAALMATVFSALFPLIPKYAIMISKDTFFADLLLLWAILIHKTIDKACKKNDIIALLGTSVGIVLIRKNGVYVIVLTLLAAMILYKRFWRQWLGVMMSVVFVSLLYSNIMLPLAGIPDGSVREILSVPFQQTARYIKYHEDEVTKEQRQSIEGVLDYEILADIYSGNLSDPVKNTYHKAATSHDLKRYFGAWFQMLQKHPEVYVAAFLNNYYGYFYPVVNDAMKLARTSVGSMANVNRDGYFDFSHCYDAVHIGLRDLLTFYELIWMYTPVLNFFMTSAFYVWIIIISFFLGCIRHNRAVILPVIMYMALVLTVLVGPSNAINYERYIFPCILGMPFLITLTLDKRNQNAVVKGV